MARVRKELPQRLEVAHLISIGVLASVCPRELVEEVLLETRAEPASASGCCRHRRWCIT